MRHYLYFIITLSIIMCFGFANVTSVHAIAPTAAVTLDQTVLEVNENDAISVSGTVSKAMGQKITARLNSLDDPVISDTTVPNTGEASAFTIRIPNGELKLGSNVISVRSEPVQGTLNASSSKTITITVSSAGGHTGTSMTDPEPLTLGENASGTFPAYNSDTHQNQYHYYKFRTKSVNSDYIVKASTSEAGGETIQVTILDADNHEMVGKQSGIGALPIAEDYLSVTERMVFNQDETRFSYLKPNTTYYLKVKRLGQHYEAEESSYSVSVEAASWSGDSESFDIDYEAAEYIANAETLKLGVAQDGEFPVYDSSISQNHYHYYKFKTKKSTDRYVLHIKTPETGRGSFRAYLMDNADHEMYGCISATIGHSDYLFLGPIADTWTYEQSSVYYDLKPDTTYYVKVKSLCSNQDKEVGYSIWIESAGSGSKWTEKDEWSFGNSEFDSGIHWTNSDEAKFKEQFGWKYLSKKSKEQIKDYIKTAGEDGQCYGMSATAVLAKKKVVTANKLTQGCDYLSQAKFKNEQAQSSIGYFYLTQVFDPYNSRLEDFEKNKTTASSQIEALLYEPKPCVFQIYDGDDFRHAVVATGDMILASEESKPYYEMPDGTQYDAMIPLYDPNVKASDSEEAHRMANLYFNPGTCEWEIPIYKHMMESHTNISSSAGAKIGYVCGDTDILNYYDFNYKVKPQINDPINKAYKTVVRIAKKSAIDLHGNTIFYKFGREVWDDDRMIAYYDPSDNLNSKRMLNIKIKDEQQVRLEPDNTDRLVFSVSYPNYFMTAKADSYTLMEADPEGNMYMHITGNYDSSMTTDDNEVWQTMEIKGKDPGYLYIDEVDSGFEITAENLDSSTITLSNESEEKQGEIHTDAIRVLVTNNSQDIKVLADTDSDGSYDTDITPEFEPDKGKRAIKNQITILDGTVKILSTKNKTAAFIKAKNKKTITIPATVKIEGTTYKITQVNKNALRGSKIRKVIIGKNVKLIKPKAFNKSKATRIVLKTKLLKKGTVKGCLKGSKVKTVQVKIGKKKQNKKYRIKYKKIFTKKNVGRKVRVK